jgi:F-type H+-transporting ATPase subunit delta
LASETTELSGIADRYAGALYDLAEADKALDAVAEDLRGLATLIDGNDDLRRLVRSPVIRREDQARAFEAVVEKAGVGDLVRRFVGVVARNRRLFALSAIAKSFVALLATRRGEVPVEVTSAKALGKGQIAALTKALEGTVGNRITLDLKVDSAIIGGLVVRVGSRMVDSSLRNKLQRLQLAMKGVG